MPDDRNIPYSGKNRDALPPLRRMFAPVPAL